MSSGRPHMLINLPPPPSDPVTPNEHGPGTPNSTTTSLSALSVVAIKDGAMGHSGRGPAQSANTLEAERADRISRLAGLERVSTVRANSSGQNLPGGYAQHDGGFPLMKERSTVGSASATGSVGGRTTWASESIDDPDKMSEDQDDEASSTGGFSDEDKASLVGFGEGANSTISGPVSTANARMIAARHNFSNFGAPRANFPPSASGQSTPMSGIVPTGTPGGADPKLMDGITYDQGIADATMQSPQVTNQQPRSNNRFSGAGPEMAESIMRDGLADLDPARQAMDAPDGREQGKFVFERDD